MSLPEFIPRLTGFARRPAVAWVVFAALSVPCAVYWARGPAATDFLSFYSAGACVNEGSLDRVYDRAHLRSLQEPWIGAGRSGVYPYYYAPAFALPFAPLALLPMSLARVVWGCACVGFLALSVLVSRRFSGLDGPVSFYLLLLLPPLFVSLALLHVSPVLLLGSTVAALGLWRARDRVSGGLFAGLLLMKPQYLVPVVLVWLVRGRVRSLLGLIAAAGTVLLLSAMASPRALLGFVSRVPEASRSGLAGLEARGVNVALYSGIRGVLPERAAVLAVAVLGTALVAVLVLVWARRGEKGVYEHALLWLSPLLITPYLGAYDLLLLYVPLAFLLSRLAADRPLLVACLVSEALLVAMALSRGPHVRLVPWSVLGVFAVCCWRSLRRDGAVAGLGTT